MFIPKVVSKQKVLDSEMGILFRNTKEQTVDKCKIMAESLRTY